jgi:hypothetical protein
LAIFERYLRWKPLKTRHAPTQEAENPPAMLSSRICNGAAMTSLQTQNALSEPFDSRVFASPVSAEAPIESAAIDTAAALAAEVAAVERELAELSAHIESAKYRLLTLIRRFDEAEGWAARGFVSCAAFLGYRVGLGKVAAREHVRVARALPELPQISESMRCGELSFSKVRALTRVATAENEAELLDVAKAATASQVEKLVRVMRRATASDDTEQANRQHDARYLQLRWQDDGTLELRGKLSPELGAVVQKAVELALEKRERDDARGAESDRARPESHAQKMADSLVDVCQSALSAEIARGVPAERVQVRLIVEPAASAETPARGVLEPGGVGLPDETVRRLCCDASVVRVSPSDSECGAESGRKKRLPSLPLRRTLQTRDRCCAFPGCDHERHLEGHHIEHWIDGGETTAENLVLLCSHHHRLIHEGGFQLKRADDGQLLFTSPTGERLSAKAPAKTSVAGEVTLRAQHRDRDLLIDEHTMPVWQGEKMDLSWVFFGDPEKNAEKAAL